MQVTPIKKSFGSYKPGDEFSLPDKVAAVFIKTRQLRAVQESEDEVEISPRTGLPKRAYMRRDLRAED